MIPSSKARLTDIEEQLDHLVYLYYGLTDDDIAVVEDGLRVIIPSVQPRRDADPPLWRTSSQDDWESYFHTLSQALGGWLVGEEIIAGRSLAIAVIWRSSNSASDPQPPARASASYRRNRCTRSSIASVESYRNSGRRTCICYRISESFWTMTSTWSSHERSASGYGRPLSMTPMPSPLISSRQGTEPRVSRDQ